MKNQYGLALAASVKQTIIPAMTMDGIFHGWYINPTPATAFVGTETSLALSDVTVPLSTVTAPTGQGNTTWQFMAAVWPTGLAANYFPWASVNLIPVGSGYSRSWSLPSAVQMLRETKGIFIGGLDSQNLNQAGAAAPAAPSAPSATTPQSLTWKASLPYEMLNGNNAFFDINWTTLFAAATATDPMSLTVTSLPANVTAGAPFTASVLSIPTGTPQGPVFNTVRIVRLLDPGLIPTGEYDFGFKITNTSGLSTNVVLKLTIA